MYKFTPNDVFFNTVETNPQYSISLYKNQAYINNQIDESPNKPAGVLSVYGTDNYVTASGNWFVLGKTFSGGDVILNEITYSQAAITASIQRSFISKSADGYDEEYTTAKAPFKLLSLGNTINYYKPFNSIYDLDYFLISSSVAFNKPIPNYLPATSTEKIKPKTDINMIEIPSMFYGGNINPGSVDLQFYITGTLAARAQDINLNGQLIQTTGSTTGDVIGVVLYNEGVILITGSTSLNTSITDYYIQPTASGGTAVLAQPKWIYFGSYQNITSTPIVSSSYILNFEGKHVVPTLTMLAHANKNDLNWSNNPSYLETGSYENYLAVTNSANYIENSQLSIKNTVSSSFANYSASFKPQTFINTVGIYDEEGDLIAIAKVANPVRKTNEQDYTFKLRIDL